MRGEQRVDWKQWCVLGITLAGMALLWGLAATAEPVEAAGKPERALDLDARGDLPWEYRTTPAGQPGLIRASAVLTYYTYLPMLSKPKTCEPIPGESYGSLSVPVWPDRPAEQHADLNLVLRGYELTNAPRQLVDYPDSGHPSAPQLYGLFASPHAPTFDSVYRVYDWNWTCNCREALLDDWPVTLAGVHRSPGETVHVPDAPQGIGEGYEVLVLYASTERITLKYTREDNVVSGYTIHVENVCVEPNLLALYQSLDRPGRNRLPALRAGQAFGRAAGEEIRVAIRDNGKFMDPRSRLDWWR
jgi:hypothetical protein